jgi:hypothetical protein
MPSESFVMIKSIEGIPTLLLNTSLEEIEKFEVKRHEIFAFFDEKVSFGTDIPLDLKGSFIISVDHFMPINKFL